MNGRALGLARKSFYDICYYLNFSSSFLCAVILVPYCCLFCVLSNDVLDITTATFSWKMHAPTSRSLQKLQPHLSDNHISPMHGHQNLRFLVCEFPKPLDDDMLESNSQSDAVLIYIYRKTVFANVSYQMCF